jgi:hypothetical protein
MAGRDLEGAVPLTHIAAVENTLYIPYFTADMWSELQWRAAKLTVSPTED